MTTDAMFAAPRRLHILVVEDERLLRRTITEVLTYEGHSVDSATDGVEGLAKFLAGRFDLVITDQAMPQMNGSQLAAAIKRVTPDKPVIMLTGLGDLMGTGERPPGVNIVLSKPPTVDAIRQAVAEAMSALL